ncbi:hypothetical protein Trydic_g22811 [Trypoxylus dichotomus]
MPQHLVEITIIVEDKVKTETSYLNAINVVWLDIKGQTVNRKARKCDGTTAEKRIRKPPSWHDDYDMGITALDAQAYVQEIPNTIDQLDGRSYREFWLEEVKTELEAHQKNGTWELVEPLENRKFIDCKWVFKIKRDEEGNVERYKARLVAKGYAQQQGQLKLSLLIKIDIEPENKAYLSQTKYTEKLIERFNMTNAKENKTPMETNLKQGSGTEKETKNDYRQLIGCLTYIANSTRPDIAFAVNYFNRFQSNPSEEHWDYAKRILKYLKHTKEARMILQPNNDNNLIAYADADWANDINSRKSTSGYIIKYRDSII